MKTATLVTCKRYEKDECPIVKAADVKLGDKVCIRFKDSNRIFPYGIATVIRITKKEITLFRPYVHTSNFVTSSGLIPYIGIEEYTVDRDSAVDFWLVEPGENYK